MVLKEGGVGVDRKQRVENGCKKTITWYYVSA